MVKKGLPRSYENQLQLAQEISLLRFKTLRPTPRSVVYQPWRVVAKFFNIPLHRMKALTRWLISRED